MQTFLAYSNLEQSAKILDIKRLNKQISECYEIIRSITGESKGWRNHPIVKAWRNHYSVVALFGIFCCEEKMKRIGSSHSCYEKLKSYLSKTEGVPWWFGNEKIHSQYRANLLAKNFDWYQQFNWLEKPNFIRYYPLDNGSILIKGENHNGNSILL